MKCIGLFSAQLKRHFAVSNIMTHSNYQAFNGLPKMYSRPLLTNGLSTLKLNTGRVTAFVKARLRSLRSYLGKTCQVKKTDLENLLSCH